MGLLPTLFYKLDFILPFSIYTSIFKYIIININTSLSYIKSNFKEKNKLSDCLLESKGKETRTSMIVVKQSWWYFMVSNTADIIYKNLVLEKFKTIKYSNLSKLIYHTFKLVLSD